MLKLPFKLEKSDVQEHLEVMFAKFMEEKKKNKQSKWNWMGQLQERIIQILPNLDIPKLKDTVPKLKDTVPKFKDT